MIAVEDQFVGEQQLPAGDRRRNLLLMDAEADFFADCAVERRVLVNGIAAGIEGAMRLRVVHPRYAARVVGMVAFADVRIRFKVRRECVGER